MTSNRQIAIRGIEHESAHEALVQLNFSHDVAMSIGGRYFSVDRDEYDRIQTLGVQPSTYHHHEPTLRIMAVVGRHG